MKVLIFGGDGFIGWPTALRLSNNEHEVTVVDNFSRRSIDQLLNCQSLTPISLMSERIQKWKQITGKRIAFKRVDVAKNYSGVLDTIKKVKPNIIIHLAEQRAAPYSMKTSETKRYTVNNNITATHNILCAIVESRADVHLIHIGSAGVYGYDFDINFTVPEGYLESEAKSSGKTFKIFDYFPMRPGSIYHMTKCMDSMMFRFYVQNNRLRITDLHQGIVWGIQTEETKMHEELINRFDYCGDYGTVLNRFVFQGVNGHPITPYGKGLQTRAFIHLENCLDCIILAMENPPKVGEKVKVFNQVTEQLCLKDLAELVSDMTGAEISHVIPNPRVEKEDNKLTMSNMQFSALGLKPIFVNSEALEDVCSLARKYRTRYDVNNIPPKSFWRSRNGR